MEASNADVFFISLCPPRPRLTPLHSTHRKTTMDDYRKFRHSHLSPWPTKAKGTSSRHSLSCSPSSAAAGRNDPPPGGQALPLRRCRAPEAPQRRRRPLRGPRRCHGLLPPPGRPQVERRGEGVRRPKKVLAGVSERGQVRTVYEWVFLP